LGEGDYRQLKTCRICGGNFDSRSLRLVDTPLANELYETKEDSLEAEKFPLELVICKDCSHVQLKHIVSPQRLFSKYVYRSGNSTFFQKHFAGLAASLKNQLPKGSLVIEVGSNDGFLLGELEKIGMKSVGIEPSEQLANFSRDSGRTAKTGYLNQDVVDEIIEEFGRAEAVVGNNVFAHIDDLLSAFKLVNELLKEGGLFIFEVADFEKLVENGLFDTIYHEHMSYHTAIGLLKLSKLSNFSLEEVSEIEPHGGSLRFSLRKGWKEGKHGITVENRIKRERKIGLDKSSIFQDIERDIAQKRSDLNRVLSNTSSQVKLVGYGAPAKLVTFCYQMGLKPGDLEYIIDDNEFKQNSFIPGLAYKVVSVNQIKELISKVWKDSPLSFLIFPWNLSSEIVEKLSKWAPPGSYIVKAFPAIETRNVG